MFHILRSHRIETLADALCDALAEQRPALDLAPDTVVVPSIAIGRWLQTRIAARTGVAANIECPFPAQFLWQLTSRVLDDVSARSPFDPDVLSWRLFRLLGRVARGEADDFAPLRAYLARGDALARMQLAERVAAVYDRYVAYRGDAWLEPWAHGRLVGLPDPSTEAWQAALWRVLLDDLGLRNDQHPFARLLAALDAPDAAARARAALPERLHLFAIPALAPAYWRAFESLARHLRVDCYALLPSSEFLGDLVAPKRRALLELAHPEAAALYEVGHALVAANGRQAIDLQLQLLQLEENGAVADDAFGYASTKRDLLHQIQRSIVMLDDGAAFYIDRGDRSLQIHACHSLVRQLEVLHDALLDAFAANPDLQPGDVLVCLPDLEAAAPAIEAVFGAAPIARRIDYRITGRAQADATPLAGAVLALLDLVHGRATADAALALLRVQACARRFGIDDDGLARIFDWLAAAGARWGWDGAHRAALGLPDESRHTWADALEQLVLGYALPADAAFDGIAGVAGVEGTQAAVAAALLEFVAALRALAERVRRPRNAARWAGLLGDAFAQFFVPDADGVADAERIRAAIGALADLAERGKCEEPLDFALVRERFEKLLAARAPGGVATGAVTFSGLGPLRALPARVVALLGLDDGALPRQRQALEFDLIAAQPRIGDRNGRDEDRALFLDALMAARDALIIGYTGFDAASGSALPPAAPVGELLDCIAHGAGIDDDAARAWIVQAHPLQAFSPRAFTAPAHSYAAELCAAADCVRLPVGARNAGRLLCAQPLAPAADETQPITVRIEQLVGFLAHPARFFVRDGLRMQLDLTGAALPEDEPFALERGDAWALRDRLIAAARAGMRDVQALRALAFGDPALPHGAPGARAFAALHADVADTVAAIDAVERRLGEITVLPIDIALDGMRVQGALPGVHARGVFGWRAARASVYARAQAWVASLVHAVQTGRAWPAYWWCEDTALLATPGDDPRAALAALLAQYRTSLRSPLLCPAKAAWAYLDASAKDDPAARRKADDVWRGSEHADGEAGDPWWRALVGERPERVPEITDFPGASNLFGELGFEDLARRVYGPMHAALSDDQADADAYLADCTADGASAS